MLAKTLGITRLIVLVNKMDDSTVEWREDRFTEIKGKLTPFLQKWGYKVKKEVTYVPCSGLTGQNLKDKVSSEAAPWYKGESLFNVLDGLKEVKRDAEGAVRMPCIGRYKDMGTVHMLGKLLSGTLRKGDTLTVMPIKRSVTVVGIAIEEQAIDMSLPGENLIVKVKGIEEEEILGGFVLCGPERVSPLSKRFKAQVAILDLLEHKPLVTAGYNAVLHIHSLVIECQIQKLVAQLDKKTGKKKKNPKFIKAGDVCDLIIVLPESATIEEFKDVPQMGRFTLRDEGCTIGIGKVLKIEVFEKNK